MSNVLFTPFMNLPNPIPGVDPGIDYALNLQSCNLIIDQHNHSPGSGQQIQPNGINISSDLAFNNQNAITLRSVRFTPQSAALTNPADIGCLYVVNNELYYNDVSGGHQIQITVNGTVNATSSGISSGTASAAFSAGVLLVKSNATSGANVEMQSAVLTNSGNLTNTLTLQAPTLSSSIIETLPPLPVSVTSIMQMDTSGNMSAVLTVDNSTLQNTSNLLSIKNLGVGTAQLANASVTYPKLAALNIVTSGDCGSFVPNGSVVQVTNWNVNITTTGRPVMIQAYGNNANVNPNIGVASGNLFITIQRNGLNITTVFMNSGAGIGIEIPITTVSFLDLTPPAGVNNYAVFAQTDGSSASIEHGILYVYEQM